MKNASRILVVVICLFNTALLLAQNTNLSGEWYFLEPGMEEPQRRVTVTEQSVIYENYMSYGVETPYWRIDKELSIESSVPIENGIRIIGRKDGKYFGGEFWTEQSGTELYLFQMREGASNLEALGKLIDQQEFKRELSKVAYKKERLEEIETYPSLDALEKSQLIEVMNHMYALEDKLGAIKNNPRIVSRIGQAALKQKFIAMGFDPDKLTNGYFMKRFVDDPDIKELLERQVQFKMY